MESKDDNFPDAVNNEPYYQETNPLQTTTVHYANEEDQVAELEDYEAQETAQTSGDATSEIAMSSSSSSQSRGLHPLVDIFADEDYIAGASSSLLPEMQHEEVKGDPDEDDQDNYQHNDYYEGDETNPGGESLCRPPEPAAPPSRLTSRRQKQRLQQLLESGEISRTDAEENDAALWKRYQEKSKQAYRDYRKKQRRVGEWEPDKKRGLS